MRFNLKAIILILGTILTIASCKKNMLPSVNLASTVATLEVATDSNKPAFTLSWEYAGDNSGVIKQYLQFSSEKEFLEPYIASSSGQEYVVTFKDLKKMHDIFGVTEDYTLNIRLLADGDNVPSVYSNKVKIDIKLK